MTGGTEMRLQDLVSYCDTLLDSSSFQDYCPNGLQVEAGSKAQRLVSGVTASQALIDAAVKADADVLLVHHGFFWKGEAAPLCGMKGRRIASLFRHGISLLAYHLPLDAHEQFGNNARLAQVFGLEQARPVGEGLLWEAELADSIALAELAQRVGGALGREPLAISAGEQPVQRLAWCTGGAQSYIEQAATLGADVFISGEISEQTVHQSRELGIHYLAAGHHATERYGVQALGEHLAQHFGLDHRFIDIANPA